MRRLLLLLLLTACVTGGVVTEYGDPIEVHFCPQENCSQITHDYIIASKTKDCAFYDLDDPLIIAALTDSRLIMEKDNAHDLSDVIDDRSAYMHNKYCILDNGVLTGSMNPTTRGTSLNFNNLIYIPSAHLHANYKQAFGEHLRGNFGKGRALHPIIEYNGHNITTAFCPQDDCEDIVLSTLGRAQHSIYFMTFSFTNTKVADMLIAKHKQGLDVRGVMEGQRKNMQYEQHKRFLDAGIPLTLEDTGATYHHKVFIVDNTTVITGSANPTKSGYHSNDENILIIEDPRIATQYLSLVP